MTSLDKKFTFTVCAFFALTVFYLCSDTVGNVFWTIYAFGLKDFLIITLSLLFIGRSKIVDLFAIGLGCYLIVPTIIRLSCAVKSKFEYTKYREILNNSEYSYFLLMVLFFISILVYYGFRNERKN